MIFANAILLLGLIAAALPLLLHLLSRSRYRNVDWAAMIFLEGMDAQHRQSARLKQWALLAMRSGLVALLAVALARPLYLGRAGGAPAAPGATTAVVLLDRSASMALNDNGRTRLDMAREVAHQVLTGFQSGGSDSGFHKGDDLWLLLIGERGASPFHAVDPIELAGYVKFVTTARGQADIAVDLRRALQILESVNTPNREIYVVCDRQATSWRNVDAAFVTEWRGRTAAIAASSGGSPVRLFVIPVGTGETDNIGIASVELHDLPAVADHPVEVEVRVRNHGPTPRAKVPLTLAARHGRYAAKPITVDLPPQASVAVSVPFTFAEPGPNELVVRLDAPGLQLDNEYRYAVDVLRELRVLVVDGDEREGAFRSESDFIRLALAPFRNPRRDAARVDVVAPENWTDIDPHKDYRVVVVANVPSLTEAQARLLAGFACGGGGVLLAPGGQSRADDYNELLGDGPRGAGVLPARLAPAAPEAEATATTVAHLQTSHSVFRFLRGLPDPAPPAAVRRYFPAEPLPAASVLARYADGRPFLLEMPVGRGRAMLVTTSVDTEWNSLPLTNFFLPFAQSAVRHLAAAAQPRANLAPGEPFEMFLDEPLDPRVPALLRPDARNNKPVSFGELAVASLGAGVRLSYAQTDVAGTYRLYPRGAAGIGAANVRPYYFSVHTPREESDLTPLSNAQWRDLERALGMARVDLDRQTVGAVQGVARHGRELWLPLLAAVILLSVIELIVARRWAGRDA